MSSNDTYDVAIIGGGLAGLAAAILLARKDHKVLLLEKDSYPKHKVCGEYISKTSTGFMERLGIFPDALQLPVMNSVQVTDTRGNEVTTTMPRGGFGISRYKLDAMLAGIAKSAGATILTGTRADDVQSNGGTSLITAGSNTYTAKVVCGAWGKRSNIDVKWQRPFIKEKNTALNNYVGIKYHISCEYPRDVVGLHNFANGYCGISAIEDDKHCLCYLTTAANLRNNGNDIQQMERDVLMKNPWLRDLLSNASFHYEHPLAISQISFEKKELVYDHTLMLGDTAGMITPLCGNGMSMAFHSAQIGSSLVHDFLKNNIGRAEMEKQYCARWKQQFSTRIALGRMVQSNFGKDRLTGFFINTMSALPFLGRALIAGTSGKEF